MECTVCLHAAVSSIDEPCSDCHEFSNFVQAPAPEAYFGSLFSADEKPSNPKDAVGIRKVPMSVMSCPVMAEVATAMMEGALKYGRHNYRTIGVWGSVYYDAVFRHMMAWWEGEDIDPDSGLSHVTKAIASLFVLRDAMLNNKWVDDRPPHPQEGWLSDLNARAGSLIDKYPEPKKAHVHKEEE